ncbi:hypothetical protein D3C73_910170 [compost metagenome]
MAINVNDIVSCIVIAIVRILTIPEGIVSVAEIHVHTHINHAHTRELAMIRGMVIVATEEGIG